ncbi:uncharacterized protein LOC132563320 [Ylistrum balloti]|uniref:uncharacterized protein LOC132563320 n=1 Tax=Ylistrum balloti TaxID=509963 RepID=UPI002905EE2C|nr:uncharacterized protein LOC132563320 [Ylistrum balloti]
MRGTIPVTKALFWSFVASMLGLLYISKGYNYCETYIGASRSISDDGVITSYRRSQQVPTRLNRLHYVCQTEWIKDDTLRYNQTTTRFDYSKKANISVCSVPKAGSTLFALVLLALEVPAGTDIESIFQTKRSHVHAQAGSKLQQSSKEMLPTRKVIVARDPFRRLFSAYVDKELTRLPVYRANTSKVVCSNRLAFDQFLHNTVSDGFKGKFIDRHVAPASLLCEPCETNYEFVAKQETLTEDLSFLLENMTTAHKHTRDSILRVLHGDVNKKTLIGVIETVVSRASNICKNLVDYLSTLWTAFKMQGVLHKDAVFPREEFEQRDAIDVSYVTSVVLETMLDFPLSSEDRRRQRQEALVQAYAGVSSDTVRGIQNMYFKDFLLFDYNILPPS